MNWSHVLIEGFCLYNEDKEKKNPSCCINGIGKIGFHCLLFNEKKKAICPFFGFQKSKTTIALTNNEGDVIDYNSFESIELDEKKWREEEKKWLDQCVNVLKELND